MDPILREMQIKFVRERAAADQYTYLIDLEPLSPSIAKLQELNALLEINHIPDEFKRKLLVDREPINNEPRDRNERGSPRN